MIRITLVDDEPNFIEEQKRHLAKLEAELQELFYIQICSNAEELLALPDVGDIAFLDIDMPGMNGMEAAERLRSRGCNAIFVFLTSMAQYAIRGYQVDALAYLVKPVAYEQLAVVLQKMIGILHRRKQQEGQERRLVLKSRDGVRAVEEGRILYVEVLGGTLTYHTKNGDIICRGTLQSAVKQMDPELFFQCNACYLVNKYAVSEIEGDSLVVGKDRLKISRGHKAEIMSQLMEIWNG